MSVCSPLLRRAGARRLRPAGSPRCIFIPPGADHTVTRGHDINLPGWCWAEILQLALVGSSSSLHSEVCNALGASDGVIHSRISHVASSLRAVANKTVGLARRRRGRTTTTAPVCAASRYHRRNACADEPPMRSRMLEEAKCGSSTIVLLMRRSAARRLTTASLRKGQ
mgnify:CR=1 FL=1